MTTLAIMTCPGRTYLSGTLRSLVGQSWSGRRVLWSDGPCEEVPPGWAVVQNRRQGPPNTFAFWDLLRAVGDGDLLLIQDDVTASPGALSYIERIGVPPGCAFVSWFDSLCKATSHGIPFALQVRAAKVLPAQARTYPRDAIRRILAARNDADAAALDDGVVADVLGDLPAYVHVPSLFRHDGAVSAVGDGLLSDIRTSASWMGETFDVDRAFRHVTAESLFGGTV